MERKRLSAFYYHFDSNSNTHKLSSNYELGDDVEYVVSSFSPTHSYASTDVITVNDVQYFPVKYNGGSIDTGYFFTIAQGQTGETSFKGYIEFTLDVKKRIIMFNKMNIDKMNAIEFKNSQQETIHVDHTYTKLIDFDFISYDSNDNPTALGIFDMTIHNNSQSSFLEFKILNNEEELYYHPKVSFMNTDPTVGFHFLIPFAINKGGDNTISIYVKTPLEGDVCDISSNDIACILKGVNIFKYNE